MGRRFIPLMVLALILCLAGNVTIVGDWSIGKKGFAIVNVSGGTIDIGDDLNIGPKAGEITFNMTGGVVDVNDSLIVARKGGAGGTLYIDDIGLYSLREPQTN